MLIMLSTDSSDRSVISLFSGAMGLDLGLEKAGLRVVLGQDVEKSCVATIRANGRQALLGDIRELSPESLLAFSGLKRGEPFLICGGPPCQPFSTAGKRLGINDPRGSLFMDFIRMIDAIRPRFFVMENVKGLTSSPLITEKNEDFTFGPSTVLEVILNEFDKLGYQTVHGILDAVNYGVPQFRERFVLMGSRDGETIFLPYPTHFPVHQHKACRWRTLREAIGDLEDDCGPCAAFSDTRKCYLDMVPEGGNWRDLPQEVVREAMGGAYASGGGKVGFYRRLAYAQPAPTLVTSPVQKASMLCHPTKLRPLSVREYARIQQFPDDWRLVGTLSELYRQIGNAVPVGLAYAIGEALLATANGDAAVETKRFRGTGVHIRLQNAMRIAERDCDDDE